MKIDPNAPAMPHSYEWSQRGEDFSTTEHGLTIRAHFAAMAMQGLNASPSILDHANSIYAETGVNPAATIARWAVEDADALIAELNK